MFACGLNLPGLARPADRPDWQIQRLLLCLLVVASAVWTTGLPAHASQPQLAYLTSDDLDLVDPNLRLDEDGLLRADGTGPFGEGEFDLHIARLQILLDREGFSPGVINGRPGEYFQRILSLYEARKGLAGLLEDREAVPGLFGESNPPFETYQLTGEDVSGPFIASLPNRIQDQAVFARMNYLRVEEKIAERFHMDETFLKALNPDADFSKPGTMLKVASIGKYLDRWVARIHADKSRRLVTAFDQKDEILAVYPASIGSIQTPSPRGRFTVRNKAGFPFYTLAPDNGFEPVDDGRQIVIAPGPNNPVGVAWIGLSKKSYGIHGTPEPSSVGTAESHGCIRLTNWDAMELARLVRTGVEVVID